MEFSFNDNQISIQNASAQDLKDFMCFITGFQAEQEQTATMPVREAVRIETKVPIPAPEPIPVADQPEPVANAPKKKVGYSSAKKLAGMLHVDMQVIKEYGRRYEIDSYKQEDTAYFHTKQMIQTVLAHSHNVPLEIHERYPVVKEYIMPLAKGRASFISKKGKYDAQTKVAVLTALERDKSYANLTALSKQYDIPSGTLSTWVHRYIVGGMILYGDEGEILFRVAGVPEKTQSQQKAETEETEAFQIAVNKNIPASEEARYQAWAKIQYAKIAKTGRQRKSILSAIYRQMTNIYGINWQQIYKQFYNHYGVRSDSTLRAVYFLQTHMAQGEYGNEHYENLFETLLDAYLKQNEREIRE